MGDVVCQASVLVFTFTFSCYLMFLLSILWCGNFWKCESLYQVVHWYIVYSIQILWFPVCIVFAYIQYTKETCFVTVSALDCCYWTGGACTKLIQTRKHKQRARALTHKSTNMQARTHNHTYCAQSYMRTSTDWPTRMHAHILACLLCLDVYYVFLTTTTCLCEPVCVCTDMCVVYWYFCKSSYMGAS